MLGTTAAALAGGTALAAYLNAKFHIKKDLSSIVRIRQAQKAHDNAGTAVFHSVRPLTVYGFRARDITRL